MPGTFSPPPRVSDPIMHHGTCVTHVPWCMPGSLTSSFLWSRWWGKTFPAFPAHAQPAILCIWQEAHCTAYEDLYARNSHKGRDKWWHPTLSVRCNYLSLPLINVFWHTCPRMYVIDRTLPCMSPISLPLDYQASPMHIMHDCHRITVSLNLPPIAVLWRMYSTVVNKVIINWFR